MNSNAAVNEQPNAMTGGAYAGSQLVSVATPFSEGVVDAVGALVKRVGSAFERFSTRRAAQGRLAALNAHLLADVGLCENDVESLSHGWTSLDELMRSREARYYL